MTTSTLDIPSFTLPRPKSRITRTKAQWKSLVEAFHTSGLTKTVFCKRHGIATSCLYRWEKLLSEDFVPADFIDVTEPVTRAKTAGQASDVHSHWQVELELGAGVILRVRTR